MGCLTLVRKDGLRISPAQAKCGGILSKAECCWMKRDWPLSRPVRHARTLLITFLIEDWLAKRCQQRDLQYWGVASHDTLVEDRKVERLDCHRYGYSGCVRGMGVIALISSMHARESDRV